MYKYAIIKNPGHSRIYFENSQEIAKKELTILLKMQGVTPQDIKDEMFADASCLTFCTNEELDTRAKEAIKTSSMYYCLFEVQKDNILLPIAVKDFRHFNDSMNQIMKYSGKTNEQFTRLLLNLALSACNTNSETLTIFDPMCGKGTTLFEGLIRGYNAIGIEVYKNSFTQLSTFILRYLKEGKYKHKAAKSKQSSSKGKKIADIFDLELYSSKDNYNNKISQNLKVFNSDCTLAPALIKKNSCDMLICDLPYGVLHPSQSENVKSRKPDSLLKGSLSGFYTLLKKGGSIVFSFNQYTLKYQDIKSALLEHNFTVIEDENYSGFEHRVDNSINRNIIVGVK